MASVEWESDDRAERLRNAEQRAERAEAQLEQAREALERIALGARDKDFPNYQYDPRKVARDALSAAAHLAGEEDNEEETTS